MAFTYDIDTNRGKVRLLLSDTNASDYQFEDDEIDAFLSMASSSLLLAASYALEAWAAAVSGGLTSEKIGDYSYSKKDAETKTKLAEKYRKEDAMTPVFEWSEWDLTQGSGITAEED